MNDKMDVWCVTKAQAIRSFIHHVLRMTAAVHIKHTNTQIKLKSNKSSA